MRVARIAGKLSPLPASQHRSLQLCVVPANELYDNQKQNSSMHGNHMPQIIKASKTYVIFALLFICFVITYQNVSQLVKTYEPLGLYSKLLGPIMTKSKINRNEKMHINLIHCSVTLFCCRATSRLLNVLTFGYCEWY